MAVEITNSIDWNKFYEMGYKPGDVVHIPVVPTASVVWSSVDSSDAWVPRTPEYVSITLPYTTIEAAAFIPAVWGRDILNCYFRSDHDAIRKLKDKIKPKYNNDF